MTKELAEQILVLSHSAELEAAEWDMYAKRLSSHNKAEKLSARQALATRCFGMAYEAALNFHKTTEAPEATDQEDLFQLAIEGVLRATANYRPADELSLGDKVTQGIQTSLQTSIKPIETPTDKSNLLRSSVSAEVLARDPYELTAKKNTITQQLLSIHSVLMGLDERARTIFVVLEIEKTHSPTALAKEFNIARSRIYQIKNQIYEKLRLRLAADDSLEKPRSSRSFSLYEPPNYEQAVLHVLQSTTRDRVIDKHALLRRIRHIVWLGPGQRNIYSNYVRALNVLEEQGVISCQRNERGTIIKTIKLNRSPRSESPSESTPTSESTDSATSPQPKFPRIRAFFTRFMRNHSA